MATPATEFQNAQNAILDINGRQLYLGNAFTLPTPGTSLANNSETPLAVVVNPATNTKALFFYAKKLGTDLNVVLVKQYKNPTLNVPGAVTVPVNARSGSPTVSVATCYLGATITANGTLMSTSPATIYTRTSDAYMILDPGTSVLFTGTQVGAGTTTAILELAWYEL